MWRKTFRDVVCDRWRIPADNFEEKIFWRALYPHALLIAWLIRRVNPDFFRLDLQTIQRIGLTTTMKEFAEDLDRFAFLNGHNGETLRSFCLLRISGRKLMRLRLRLSRAGSRERLGELELGTPSRA